MAEPLTFSTAVRADDVGDERPFGDLLTELARETNTLIAQEIQLAKVELSQKAARVGRGAEVVGAGAVLVYVGLTLVAMAGAIALSAVMALWLAALLAGGAFVVVGWAVARGGLAALRRVDLVPRRTVETLKEDARWAKEQAR